MKVEFRSKFYLETGRCITDCETDRLFNHFCGNVELALLHYELRKYNTSSISCKGMVHEMCELDPLGVTIRVL